MFLFFALLICSVISDDTQILLMRSQLTKVLLAELIHPSDLSVLRPDLRRPGRDTLRGPLPVRSAEASVVDENDLRGRRLVQGQDVP